MADDGQSVPHTALSSPASSEKHLSPPTNNAPLSHSSRTHAASPLQQSFPSSPIMSEVESSSNEETSAQLERKKNETRNRGMSRSSSVPAAMHSAAGSTVNSTSSVRHMTCFWWREKGHCSKRDEDCAYAHYDTGLYTRAPQHLFPGERALAGRKLERAQRSLAVQYVHKSSGSLPSLAGSRQGSRSGTPVSAAFSGAPRILHQIIHPDDPIAAMSAPFHSVSDVDLTRLGHDNELLKNLVEQNSKEKAVLINTIESLQAEAKGMQAELEGLRIAQEQLLAEREGLHNRLQQLDRQQMPIRSASHPFGPIGRARVNTETRYLGGLLDSE